MAGQIRSYMDPLLHELNELEHAIKSLINECRDEQTRLDSIAAELLTGAEAFAGDAAQAFAEAMQQAKAALEGQLAALESVAGQIAAGASRIISTSEAAEAALFSGAEHLGEALGRLTYDALERSGGDAVHAILHDMARTLANAAHQGSSAWGDLMHGNVLGAVGDVAHMADDGIHLLEDGWSLLGDLPGVLIQWGWDIYHALGELYGWLWNQADALVHRLLVPPPHPHLMGTQNAQYDLTGSSHNMEDLIRDIDQQYNRYGGRAPIGIRQIGPDQLLVTLAGTEFGNLHVSNNAPDAFDSGLGDLNDPYEQDVQVAIEQYLRQHPETKQPVSIVVAGHSYGGMVAQELALHGGGPGYTISSVITFGSPQVGPMVRGVRYTEYVDRYDPVPLLSWYKLNPFMKSGGLVGGPLGGILGGVAAVAALDYGPAQLKLAFTGETYVPDVGRNPLSPFGAHGAYEKSQWLARQPLPFNVHDMGPTSYYSITPQNPVNDSLLLGWTLLKDYATS